MKVYVYIHCKPDGSVFYVGKGRDGRARSFSQRNHLHKNIVEKHGRENIIVSTFPCQSEDDAFYLEAQLIKGFRELGHELANRADGGQGPNGLRYGPHSEARRRSISEGHRRNAAIRAARNATQ